MIIVITPLRWDWDWIPIILAKLIALKLLLLFTIEKGIKNLQVYRDSMVVINWAKCIQNCHILILIPIVEEIQRHKILFDHIVFTHVYRELNRMADRLSKEAMRLEQGIWQIEDNLGTGTNGYYHRLYHED